MSPNRRVTVAPVILGAIAAHPDWTPAAGTVALLIVAIPVLVTTAVLGLHAIRGTTPGPAEELHLELHRIVHRRDK
jgi:hypothetical protein